MPIHKATIVPRGNTLGMVAYLPEKDQMNMSREQLLAHIDICMGGRVAEELIYGQGGVTTGAGSDLQQATSTAWVGSGSGLGLGLELELESKV